PRGLPLDRAVRRAAASRGTRAARCAFPFTGIGRDVVSGHRMSNRSSIMMAIVTVGAMALSTAVVIGAFMVVDEQAAQGLRSGPRIVRAEKRAALPARSSRTAAGSGQSTNGAAPAGGPRSPAPTQAPPAGGGASANGAAPSPAPEQGSAAPAAPTPDTMV